MGSIERLDLNSILILLLCKNELFKTIKLATKSVAHAFHLVVLSFNFLIIVLHRRQNNLFNGWLKITLFSPAQLGMVVAFHFLPSISFEAQQSLSEGIPEQDGKLPCSLLI